MQFQHSKYIEWITEMVLSMKERSIGPIALCCAMLAGAVVARLCADIPESSGYKLPSNSQVIGFLIQSIDWYRHVYSEQQIANKAADLLFLDDNQPIAVQIVRLSFEFAKADAALAAGPNSGSQPQSTGRTGAAPSDLARFIALKNEADNANQKTTEDINAIRKKIAAAHGDDRRKLEAALEEAQSRLELLEYGSKTIDDLVEFAQSASAGQGDDKDLASVIEDLAQSVPEVSNSAATPLTKFPTRDASSRATSDAHNSGILGLASEVSTLNRKLRAVDETIRLTDNLSLSEQNLRIPVATFLRDVPSVLGSLQTTDLASLRQQKVRLDALTAQLKSLSPATVALDKQKVLLTVYRSHLAAWRRAVFTDYRQAWRQLIIRLLVVATIIALLAGFSEISRRLTVRHVQDPERRRLIIIVRQLLTWFSIVMVVFFSFASNLGSLATYFGLLSAGLAVALQNVILASVGYVLLIGKRGIRIGDRVRISGVTGDVIDIGLLQFQVREFDLNKQQFTGHIATFSNSFVFVSPATGLVNFKASDKAAGQSQLKNGVAEPRSTECGSAAEMKT